MAGSRRESQVLAEIDSEVRNLYEYSLAAGLTHDEIIEKARPLLQPLGKDLFKRKCFSILKIIAFCLVVGAFLSSDPVQRSLSMNGRHLLIKVLPWWDWTDLYRSSCLIYNPYFQNERVLVTDCQICEDLFEIDRLNTTTSEEINSVYLQNDVPVIVSGAMNDWPAMKDDFTILNFTEVRQIEKHREMKSAMTVSYAEPGNLRTLVFSSRFGGDSAGWVLSRTHGVECDVNGKEISVLGYLFADELKDQPVCMLQTNLRVVTHQEIFQRILSNEFIKRWFAHWENCQNPSVKFLRKFYSRPYFIPDVVQMTESNWLFMSSSYRGKKFKLVDVSPAITVMWIAQLRGYHYIQLEPKSPCEEMCNILQDTVEEGDIVLFNPTLWNFLYLPGEETENLAIAAGGFSQLL